MKTRSYQLAIALLLLGSALVAALEPFPLLDRTRVEPQLLDPMMIETAVDSTYLLGPGDFLQIFVENHNYAVQVGPTGEISLDEIGLVKVGGLQIAEAQKLLIEKLSKKYRQEYCFVSLAKLKRFMLPIAGAVYNPNSYPVDGVARVSWAIRLAGGTTFQADDRHVRLVRGSDTIIVDLYELNQKGDFSSDPLLQQGDKIFVPRMNNTGDQVGIAAVDGSLHFVPHYPDWTIYDYLNITDQWAHRGNSDHISLLKADQSRHQLPFTVSTERTLDPGDQIGLVGMPLEVYVGGAVVASGAQPYRPGWKVVDYLKAAGVMVIAEDVRRVSVIRADKTVEKVETLDAAVSPGDFIRLDKSAIEYVKDWAAIITAVVSMIYTIVLIDATTNK